MHVSPARADGGARRLWVLIVSVLMLNILQVPSAYARVDTGPGRHASATIINPQESVSLQSRAPGAGSAASRAGAGARSAAAGRPSGARAAAGRAGRAVANRARPVAKVAGRAAAGVRSGAARMWNKAKTAVASGPRPGVRAVSMRSSRQQRPAAPIRRPVAVAPNVRTAFNKAAGSAAAGTRSGSAAVRTKQPGQSGAAWRAPTRADVRGGGSGGRSPSLLTPVFNRASGAGPLSPRFNAAAGQGARRGGGGNGAPAPVLRVPGPRF